MSLQGATTPQRVRTAATLLWASLALAAGESFLTSPFPEDSWDWTLSVVAWLFNAANAYVIFLLLRRRRWARVVLLALTAIIWIGTLALYLAYPAEDLALESWSYPLFAIGAGLDAVAVWMLYSGASVAWFLPVSVTPDVSSQGSIA